MKKITQITVLFITTIIIFSCKRNDSKFEDIAVDTMAIASDTMAIENIPEEPLNNVWQYETSIDKMTSNETKFATITSNESLNLEPPYDGINYGYLTLRKKNELNIYISIDRGQISGEYDNLYVMVRFDDEKPIRFDYNEPQDYSSDLIFIDNESKFLSKLKKSKKVLISLPLYQNGNQVLEFNTSDLKW